MRSWKSKLRGSIAAGAIVALAALPGRLPAASPYNDAVLADGPLLYWTFDEASGNAIEQINGVATAELVPMGNATRGPSTSTFGGVGLGSAAVFDGTTGTRFQASDVVPGAGPGGDFIATQRWVVETWINLGSSGPTYISEMAGPGGGTNNPALISGFLAGFELFAGGRTGNNAPVPISTGQWHHVVAAFYGNSGGFADNLREIYVDGVLALSDTTSNFSAGHGLNRFAVGNAMTPNENPSPLMIDEYAIYELPGGGLLNDQLFTERIAGHYYTAVPEPSTLALGGVALAMLALRIARRRNRC